MHNGRATQLMKKIPNLGGGSAPLRWLQLREEYFILRLACGAGGQMYGRTERRALDVTKIYRNTETCNENDARCLVMSSMQARPTYPASKSFFLCFPEGDSAAIICRCFDGGRRKMEKCGRRMR